MSVPTASAPGTSAVASAPSPTPAAQDGVANKATPSPAAVVTNGGGASVGTDAAAGLDFSFFLPLAEENVRSGEFVAGRQVHVRAANTCRWRCWCLVHAATAIVGHDVASLFFRTFCAHAIRTDLMGTDVLIRVLRQYIDQGLLDYKNETLPTAHYEYVLRQGLPGATRFLLKQTL